MDVGTRSQFGCLLTGQKRVYDPPSQALVGEADVAAVADDDVVEDADAH